MQRRGSFSAFEIYLRTGRRVQAGVEVKFNPWHDPEDGRFTFAGSGQYFGPGGVRVQRGSGRRKSAKTGELSVSKRLGPQGDRQAVKPGPNDPGHPRNYSVYVVKRGDTLTKIAAMRKGVTVAGLADLNGIAADKPLLIGQRIKLQNQDYLDRAREGMRLSRAIDYYMQTHGGRLPPDVAHPPSLESQILDSNWKQEIRGPYNFYIDILSRLRRMFGEVPPSSLPERSRGNQKRAGGPDRRPTDDGGHFAAPRLGGPIDEFNHFAQDRNLNRGAYRVLEKQWFDAVRAGHKVFIDIIPHYVGTSLRPDDYTVIWYVDGERHRQKFANEPGGKPRVRQ